MEVAALKDVVNCFQICIFTQAKTTTAVRTVIA